MKNQTLPTAPEAAPNRWRRLLPAFTVMPVIALILSGAITWINLGWVDGFAWRWGQAFVAALPMLPLGLLVMLMMDRVLGNRLRALPRVVAVLATSLCTAVVMETFVAGAVTLSNHGLTPAFLTFWGGAFVRSLPVGVVIALLMGFVVKPRLARWTGVA